MKFYQHILETLTLMIGTRRSKNIRQELRWNEMLYYSILKLETTIRIRKTLPSLYEWENQQ